MERKLLSICETAKARGVDSCCCKALEASRDTAGDSVLAQPLETASGTAQEIENVMPFGLAIPLLLIHSDISTQVRSDIYKNIHFTSFITAKDWTEANGQEGRSIPQPKVLALRRLPALHDTAKFPHPADFTEVSRSKTGDRPLTNTSGMKTGTYVTSQELL